LIKLTNLNYLSRENTLAGGIQFRVVRAWMLLGLCIISLCGESKSVGLPMMEKYPLTDSKGAAGDRKSVGFEPGLRLAWQMGMELRSPKLPNG